MNLKGFGLILLSLTLLLARAHEKSGRRPLESGSSDQALTTDRVDERSPGPMPPQGFAAGARDEVDLINRDPAIGRSWGLEGTDSLRAWRITPGDRSVIVAVIDTGVDISHPDLNENVWMNQGEIGQDEYGRDKKTNGLDDDRNGYVDDVYGWNFAANTNDVYDRHGHGTHIAGIIGAVGGNGIGLSGVSPRVSLMVLKYCEPYGETGNAVANTVAAIRYSVRMGAHIINYSAGGPAPNPEELAAIREAGEQGVLIVAAAGNERSNSDFKRYYPADYDLPNILSITAFDRNLSILPSSNYGVQTVDLAAPGKDIFSTLPSGTYGYLSGTSQATAFATGVAALVMAKYRLQRAPERVAAALTQTGDVDPALADKTKYRSRLNTYRALAIEGTGVSATGTMAANSTASTSPFGELVELVRGIELLRPHGEQPQLGQRHDVRGPAGKISDGSF